jgi:hypothetical protein
MNQEQIKLKIEYIDIKNITPYKNNAKLHPDEQIDEIIASIKSFGFNDPIGIDKGNIIIDFYNEHNGYYPHDVFIQTEDYMEYIPL